MLLLIDAIHGRLRDGKKEAALVYLNELQHEIKKSIE